ncbi:MAG: SGNH/GDSL hydrolase family protein [Ignavibacteriales bacterium]|nr:SGNH/GDSL hydrolase family protein [Ignavibacteriales bacterium]
MNTKKIYKQESKKKTPKWFYLVIILLPILLLIILEISLRFFNYGNDYKEWIDLTERFEILNPDIANKYFSNIENIPFSSESFLLKTKPENSFRVISLGGSSGAGYPYQNSGSFTKYVRKALEFSFPEKKIEVANISMAAINSYTILDLLPEILEKKPDLILMYLGHNEYYGVLGAASNQSFASSIFLTNLIIKLKEFRITQLLTNFLTSASQIITTHEKISDGTLMSQNTKKKLIGLNSPLFNKGLEQFESNLSDILELCSDKNVPVIIGTLVSNLRDLKPFNNVDDGKNPKADLIFEKAQQALVNNDLQKADSLFRDAKDLDGLRFRAPEIFNSVINNLAVKYNCEIAKIDSFINSQSKFGIVGNDLMIDHLHPNLKGYQLFGKQFYKKIINSNKVALGKSSLDSYSEIEKLVEENYNFTKYDSTIAAFRVKLLKNDWPFFH